MNRNFYGAVIFSLIVGGAIVVNKFFFAIPAPQPVFEVRKNSINTTNSLEIIDNPVGYPDIDIQQAVYKVKENQVEIELLIVGNTNTIPIIDATVIFGVDYKGQTTFTFSQAIHFEAPDYDMPSNIRKVSIPLKENFELKQNSSLFVLIPRSCGSGLRQPAFKWVIPIDNTHY